MVDNSAPPSTTALRAKLYYGVGAVAYGTKESGFAYLLLIFYSQVLGLPHNLVGTGIFIALLVDAVSDPIVGTLSDNLRSRWGRRHPFMYASALPVALCYFFIWSPPAGLSSEGLFIYFLVMAILIRTLITLYEIPSSSLVAELTDDYHQRTSFMSWRHLFGWWGGLSILVFTYLVLLVPTDEYPVGVLNPEGYQTYGAIASVVIFTTILMSALGTHRYIPQLRKAPAQKAVRLRGIFRQTIETVRNHSFGALFLSALFGSLASGVSTSMNVYMNTFYWELDNQRIALMTSTLFASAGLAMIMAPRISRHVGKKMAAVMVGLTAAFLSPMPFILRTIGFFPENGTDQLFHTLIFFNLIEVTLIIITGILVDSMIADIVEQSQLKTGRRSEGLFFAARNFVRKSVSGMGVLIATSLLTIVAFPKNAQPGAVPADTITNLGLLYAPTVFVFYLMSITIIFAYRITRETHEENVRKIDGGAGESL
jgi:Na+/melibiose symporter-like transporter